MTSDQLDVARKIALKLLESRQRTEAELRRALAKKNTPEPIIDQVIERFTEVGLLNDEAFASALTNTRLEIQRRGSHRIRLEMRDKGLSDEIIAETLSNIDPDAEYEAALAFATKKARSLARFEPLVARRRLYGALARRGFNSDIVKRAAEAALASQVEDDYDV